MFSPSLIIIWGTRKEAHHWWWLLKPGKSQSSSFYWSQQFIRKWRSMSQTGKCCDLYCPGQCLFWTYICCLFSSSFINSYNILYFTESSCINSCHIMWSCITFCHIVWSCVALCYYVILYHLDLPCTSLLHFVFVTFSLSYQSNSFNSLSVSHPIVSSFTFLCPLFFAIHSLLFFFGYFWLGQSPKFVKLNFIHQQPYV